VLRTSALSISANSELQLNDNDLILDYTSATPLAQCRRSSIPPAAGGTWNGFGITSMSAKDNPSHNTTLGVMEASDYQAILGNPNYGDANFSGTVDFDDYVRIDVGFNTGLTGWSNGDFNGNGQVNFDDYVLIDIAFNTQGSVLSRPPGPGGIGKR
jgi:hypothetical protein